MSWFRPIFLCTLIGGTLDISEALIFSWAMGRGPALVLRVIASGLFGSKALTGPPACICLGLAIHYIIAFCWSALFVLLASRIGMLVSRPFLAGILYGLLIYGVMNFIVLPLAGLTAHRHFTLIGTANAVLALVFCMGLPLAYLCRATLPTLHKGTVTQGRMQRSTGTPT